MPTSQIIEVAIGLMFVYYVLGSVVSFVTQMLLESAETRGATLEDHLKRIAGDKTVDLINLPQMQALRPIRYKKWWGVFGANTEAKKMEKVPVTTLVDAFFDLTGLTGREKIDPAQLTSVINKLPASEGKAALIQWVTQGVTNINDLRTRANDYFSGMLSQAAATFRSHARSIVIIFSIILVFALGTDTIQIARDLWGNAELRAVATAEATAMSQADSAAGLDELIQALSDTTMRITWLQTSDTFPKTADTAEWAGFVILKFIGLSITAWATSQGSSFWYDLLKKLTGRKTVPVEEGKG
ncbi:MAG: hypothetical protein HFACDABA_02263 [Anaerolineales bacterium]|nr:hypothetical protein [Anaerolineales bacterium]